VTHEGAPLPAAPHRLPALGRSLWGTRQGGRRTGGRPAGGARLVGVPAICGPPHGLPRLGNGRPSRRPTREIPGRVPVDTVRRSASRVVHAVANIDSDAAAGVLRPV